MALKEKKKKYKKYKVTHKESKLMNWFRSGLKNVPRNLSEETQEEEKSTWNSFSVVRSSNFWRKGEHKKIEAKIINRSQEAINHLTSLLTHSTLLDYGSAAAVLRTRVNIIKNGVWCMFRCGMKLLTCVSTFKFLHLKN